MSLMSRLCPSVWPFVGLSVTTLLLATPALAAGRDCTGWDALKDKPAITAGKVVSADKRTFFIKGETDDKACPAETKVCRRKGFLVPGNSVVLSGRSGDFVCVTYVNGKGIETNGWLPKAAVEADASASAAPWPGTWVREEAEVTIKVDSKGSLAIHGDATYGSKDPDRVKRGAVNVGEISGAVVPKGDRLSFAMSENKTLPVDKGDDTTCKVWMQRVGDYLVVDDNNACGGMNVSFRGTYARR